MKIYKKKQSTIKVITDNHTDKFGGIEVVQLNMMLKGLVQSIVDFDDNFEYYRDATVHEIRKYGRKLSTYVEPVKIEQDEQIKS